MRIRAKNFKSLVNIPYTTIKPLTVLSGTNSSGKSSFIQMILLIKQTIDLDSSSYPIYKDGKYYSIRDYVDIISGKDKSKALEFAFLLSKADFVRFAPVVEKSIFDSFDDYECEVIVNFRYSQGAMEVERFSLKYKSDSLENFITITNNADGQLSVESNNEYFVKGFFEFSDSSFSNLKFLSFFPSSFDAETVEVTEGEQTELSLVNQNKTTLYVNLSALRSFFKAFAKNLYYLGPLRVEPKDVYSGSNDPYNVGNRGENVAESLEKMKDEPVISFWPTFTDEGVSFNEVSSSLLEVVNFWICDVFGFGKRLYSKSDGDNYSIFLENHNGVPISIRHVGFGVSQVLPIIVQGLLMSKGGILVLEQPEIHLHPRIQSYLFDFAFSLMLAGKTILVETHSDHFVTRMRRRIAESDSDDLRQLINLSFIKLKEEGVDIEPLDLNELGALTHFPDEFIERPEVELKAIVKAQMVKRIKKAKK
ncbi:AAA family ATPase [Flaviaesturariibacter amylovorans]|uniref:Endonuclease GajA/Old nuclease/RecF-like AAA domain-containing protein n=1 Tax=Flaviaesturariibacter amylovorans TaxID=1084520 RepID=A0ABP8HI84_9BACT